jgi:hypothetical protein
MFEGKKSIEKFLGVYLIIAFAFGIIGLADGLLSLIGFSSIVYASIIIPLAILFFFFNIFTLVHFIQGKLAKITWVLPIYHLATYVLFFIIGLTLSIQGSLFDWVVILLGITAILTSIFEIAFSFYLFRRFKFF